MAKPKPKRRAPNKPKRRTYVERLDRYQIETVVSSAGRAEQLVNESWHRAADLTPFMWSAILRDLMVEIGTAHRAGKNLAEAFLEPGKAS